MITYRRLSANVLIFLSIALILSTKSAYAFTGTLCIENQHPITINVGLTHFGCAGIFDGILTVCTPDGAFSNVHKGDLIRRQIELGMSNGYDAVGKLTAGTRQGEFVGCPTGLNGYVVYSEGANGTIQCKVLDKACPDGPYSKK